MALIILHAVEEVRPAQFKAIDRGLDVRAVAIAAMISNRKAGLFS